ncbi:MAG: hypothetical protein R3Y56_10440 [Akkermansia sp.]
MTRALTTTLLFATLLGLASCCPPPPSYDCSCTIVTKRDQLYSELIDLLPAEQRELPEAQEEAKWLADTSQLASAAISRINGSCFPNWSGNILINMNFQDRGLCWHYQHDMHRELRRRKLQYFKLGVCVRDKGKIREHNCNYITALDGAWPNVIVLDAWIGNGRLDISQGWRLSQRRWKDSPDTLFYLNAVYLEEHEFEIESWSQVKGPDGKYVNFWANEARRSEQYHRMYENIMRGKQEHPDKLTTYDR